MTTRKRQSFAPKCTRVEVGGQTVELYPGTTFDPPSRPEAAAEAKSIKTNGEGPGVRLRKVQQGMDER